MRAFRQWLKWIVAGDELRRLERYRIACREAYRWLGDKEGATTAIWIESCGEDHPRRSISVLREELRRL